MQASIARQCQQFFCVAKSSGAQIFLVFVAL